MGVSKVVHDYSRQKSSRGSPHFLVLDSDFKFSSEVPQPAEYLEQPVTGSDSYRGPMGSTGPWITEGI